MAPELFDSSVSYGKEVDIWALGAFIYELATSYPPNVTEGVPYDRLGSHLKQHVPRLEGGDYSDQLRGIIAFCLEEEPSARPTIEQVQKHPYILNTSAQYPTSSLARLVIAFRGWEAQGGSRKSLFMQHGAQASSEPAASIENEWNFSTTQAFEAEFSERISAQEMMEAYGPSVVPIDETARPGELQQAQKGSRRRPPPEALGRFRAPLEKIFDPNTKSNYEDNSKIHYGRQMGSSTSDLPLRDDSAQTFIKDTMIDLGGMDSDTDLTSFPDLDTIKANRRRDEHEEQYGTNVHNFSRPPLSDPADINPNRRTQDWKFPSMAPPASADPELPHFPISYEIPRPAVTPGSGGRPTLVHHPTEPVGVGAFGSTLSIQPSIERLSMRESLIDLDMSMPDTIPELSRPSTANSDVGSTTSEQIISGNPFELERHASYQPIPSNHGREPSIYVTDDSSVPLRLGTGNLLQDLADMSDFSASDVEGGQDVDHPDGRNGIPRYGSPEDPDFIAMPPPRVPIIQGQSIPRSDQGYSMTRFPPLPPHPSIAALTGTAPTAQIKSEIDGFLTAMTQQLGTFRDVYDRPLVLQRQNSGLRRER